MLKAFIVGRVCLWGREKRAFEFELKSSYSVLLIVAKGACSRPRRPTFETLFFNENSYLSNMNSPSIPVNCA